MKRLLWLLGAEWPEWGQSRRASLTQLGGNCSIKVGGDDSLEHILEVELIECEEECKGLDVRDKGKRSKVESKLLA